MINISKDEFKKIHGTNDWYEKYGDGYRIVYFYSDNSYYIGAFSKTIEGFMINFCDVYPIEDESDIPEFISNDDLLDKYLTELNDISSVAIYKTDGYLVAKKDRITLV